MFFDDILIYSPIFEEHIHHIQLTLSVLRKHKLYAKRSKCQFGQQRIEYLGHIISHNGVSTDPDKVQDMVDWPKPKNLKGLRGFLGLTGYYRKFIQGYGQISKPLTDMLKKGGFIWTKQSEDAYERLKTAMVSSPVLALPDFSRPFIVETDASSTGLGAVLMQEGRPIAYLSEALSPKNQVLSIYEREFMAVLMAIQKWKHYLQGHHFILKTDQQSIKYIMEQRFTTALQQRWISKLLGLDYEIQYKKGVENRVADALSRKDIASSTVYAITTVQPQWVSEVLDSYKGDLDISKILTATAPNDPTYADYSVVKGLIRWKGRLCVGKATDLRSRLIHHFHDSSIGGHSGGLATYHWLKSLFFWPGLKGQVISHVQQCDVSKRAKHENSPYAGLLEPLQIPQGAWSHISMDFIEGLPKSNGKDSILVVIDRFTKYGHFLALSHPFTASTVAQLFLDHIFKHHRQPVSIVTNRDKIFTS